MDYYIQENKGKNIAFSEYGAGGPKFRFEDFKKFRPSKGYRTLLETLWAREAEGRRKMVRTDKWKYITDSHGDMDELYDLENDPWELINLSNNCENKNIILEMKDYLLDWMIETEDKKPIQIPKKIGRDFFKE